MSKKSTTYLDIDAVTAIDTTQTITTGDDQAAIGEKLTTSDTLSRRVRRRRSIPSVGASIGESRTGIVEETLALKDAEITELKQKLTEIDLSDVQAAAPIEMKMPVTGESIRFELEYLDPSFIEVSDQNERDQSLLDLISLQDILTSIKENGQQKPGTVRPIAEEGRYELIEGSRRLACCRLLGIPYLTLVGAVPDQDVRALSKIENQHHPISLYEKAKFYQKLIETQVYRDWEQMALAEGFSSSSAYRYKRLAEIDQCFVRCYAQPGDLGVRFADWLTTKLNADRETRQQLMECGKQLCQQRLDRTQQGLNPLTADEVVKLLKKSIRNPMSKPSIRKPIVYRSTDGGYKMKHSVTASGNTKFELQGVPQEKVDKAIETLKIALSLK